MNAPIESDLPPRERFLLGCALLAIHTRPGHGWSERTIAAWAGCSPARIHQITDRAMLRLRRRLIRSYGGERGRELVEAMRAWPRAQAEADCHAWHGPDRGEAA